MNRTHEVDVDHRPPVLVLQILDGSPHGDTSDVHHHVHHADLGVDLARERRHPVVVGNVAREVEEHDATGSDYLGDHLVECLGVQIGQHQLGALRRRRLCRRPADSARRAGDQHLATAQRRHRRLHDEIMDTHGFQQ